MYQPVQPPQAPAPRNPLGNPVVPVAYSRFSFWQPRSLRMEPRALPVEPLDLDQRVRQSGEW
jgi:hypothetical protein